MALWLLSCKQQLHNYKIPCLYGLFVSYSSLEAVDWSLAVRVKCHSRFSTCEHKYLLEMDIQSLQLIAVW